MHIEGNKLHSGRRAAQDGPRHFAKNAESKKLKNVGAVITVAILRVPESWPTTRKLVLPLTEVVTRPLCFLMRSSISWRCKDSSAPVITKVLPVKHSAWPLGTSYHAPHHHGGPIQLRCHCCRGTAASDITSMQIAMRNAVHPLTFGSVASPNPPEIEVSVPLSLDSGEQGPLHAG